MASAERIGQAVVTDPLRGRASGYTLVAQSPSLRREDAQHLSEAPQVTDELHTGDAPGPYVGWHPLAGGRWALVRRFTSGVRRGRFHRIVVHALVIGPEVFAAAADDPWLLVARCRFRAAGGGPSRTLTEWGAAVETPDVSTLPDLEVEAPDDPLAARYDILAGRRTFLVDQRGAAAVRAELAAVLAALEAGKRVLLPAGSTPTQLLALASSVLPVADRRRLGWTTHLAADAAHLFHLASTPEPRAVRATLADPDAWYVAGEPIDIEGTGAEALARAVVEQDLFPNVLWGGLRKDGTRLVPDGPDDPDHDPDAVPGLIEWLRGGGEQAYRGFDSIESFYAWLRVQPLGAVAGRCSPEGALAAAVGTALRQMADGTPWADATASVVSAIDSAGLLDAVLDVQAVEALATERTGGHGDDGVVAALALAWDGLERRPARRRDDDRRLRLLRLGITRTGRDGIVPLPELLGAVARPLLAAPASVRDEALRLLATEPAASMSLAARIAAPDDVEPAVVAQLFALLDQPGCREAAGDVADRLLLPLAEADGEAGRALTAARRRALTVASADTLATWLADAEGARYDDALAALNQRTVDGDAAVASIVGTAGERMRGGWRPHARLAGLSAALAAAEVPVASWLPVAIAEARWLDGRRDDAGRTARQAFKHFVEGPDRVPLPAARHHARQLLDSTRGAAEGDCLGPAGLALLQAASPGLVAEPQRAAAILARLGELDTVPVLRVVAPVATALADQLEATEPSTAAAVRRNLWRQLAQPRHRWRRLPAALVDGFDALPAPDRKAIATAFAHKVGQLGDHEGDRRLVASLRAAAADDPQLAARYAQALDAGDGGGLWATIHTLRGRAEPHQLLGALQRQLPRAYADKLRQVLPVIWSAELLPTERWVLERELLPPILNQARGQAWIAAVIAAVPDGSALARRPSVAVALATRVGLRWRDDERSARRFLDQLVAAERYEAVAAFLVGSERRRPGCLERWSQAANPPRQLLRRLHRASQAAKSRADLQPVRASITRLAVGGRA